MTRTLVTALLTLVALAPTACGDGADDSSTGELRVTVYGESFIEEGIPASDVSDGWAVSFEAFEVTVRDVEVAGAKLSGTPALDLSLASQGAGHTLVVTERPEGSYGEGAFTLTDLRVKGKATKGAVEKSFDWRFEEPVRYVDCETTTKVHSGQTATFQITVHADHFLYDSLVSEEPVVAFSALAEADANDDGAITQEELSMAPLGAFDPGNDDEIDDLWSWLVALSRTLGHVDGEGHCHVESP